MTKENKIEIDLNKWSKSDLSLIEYSFLQCLYYKQYDLIKILFNNDILNEDIDLDFLEKELYIKLTGDTILDIFPRQKCIDLFQSKDEKTIDTWIQEWVDLFPKGVKSGGYYIRSNKEDVLKKMVKFIKTRGYSKDVIMKATKNYVERKALENYSYMMKAEYFIEKDGISALATECENINTDDINDNWTRNII